MEKYLIENHCFNSETSFRRWVKKQIKKDVYLDGDDLVDMDTQKTICTFVKRNVTYSEALAAAKKFYNIP